MVGGESIRDGRWWGGRCGGFGRDIFEDVFVEISDKVFLESSERGGCCSEACEVWLIYGELTNFAREEIIRRNQIQDPLQQSAKILVI